MKIFYQKNKKIQISFLTRNKNREKKWVIKMIMEKLILWIQQHLPEMPLNKRLIPQEAMMK